MNDKIETYTNLGLYDVKVANINLFKVEDDSGTYYNSCLMIGLEELLDPEDTTPPTEEKMIQLFTNCGHTDAKTCALEAAKYALGLFYVSPNVLVFDLDFNIVEEFDLSVELSEICSVKTLH